MAACEEGKRMGRMEVGYRGPVGEGDEEREMQVRGNETTLDGREKGF